MYLLSYKDITNSNYGFSSSKYEDTSRYSQVTDYAKAVGAYWNTSVEYLDNGYYWLRSPVSNFDDYAYYVSDNSYVYSNDYVSNSYHGVRVACTINLE